MFDCHIHTEFSTDSNMKITDAIREAQSKKLMYPGDLESLRITPEALSKHRECKSVKLVIEEQ